MISTVPNLFAYGSNMLLARLRSRIPGAQRVGSAWLADHRLAFHKIGSLDGSGKADAVEAPGGSLVWGALFEVAHADLQTLDMHETGYERVELRVMTAEQQVRTAWVYRALHEWTDDDIEPFAWYRELCLAGAREHELPREYIARIEAVATVEDPDATRAATHRALIET